MPLGHARYYRPLRSSVCSFHLGGRLKLKEAGRARLVLHRSLPSEHLIVASPKGAHHGSLVEPRARRRGGVSSRFPFYRIVSDETSRKAHDVKPIKENDKH